MVTFVKAQAAALAASLLDFSVTIVLVELFHAWYLAASIAGTVSGGIANFLLARIWVFNAREKMVHWQAVKFLLVWLGYLALISGGVYAVTNYGGISYVLSKILVSVILGISYNYVLQKRFVFK
ncbi:MAG: hypothetical protein NVSMB63_07310 [Sediminibacterium sp.]